MIWSCALPVAPAPRPWLVAQLRPIWAAMLANRPMAGPILSAALRENRSLGSKDRPLVGDFLLALIRHEQALARIHPDPVEALIQVCSSGIPDLPEPEQPYAVALSLPVDLAEEWWVRLGEEAAIGLAKTLSSRAPVFLRQLRPGEPTLPVPYTRLGPATLRLEGRCNLIETPAFRDGWIEIQDLGSQQIAEAAFPGKGARVLDLCAGAGGKSLALAALGATVQAWDVRPAALRELGKRAERCGLKIQVAPPSGRYDLVLVDAPCSGTGVLRRHPENRWKLAFPTQIQEELLRRAMGMAPRVIYATCALSQRENELLVRRVADPLWERTIWPEVGGSDGFFMAELQP